MSAAEGSNLAKQGDPGEGAIKKAKEGNYFPAFIFVSSMLCEAGVIFSAINLSVYVYLCKN